MESEAKNKELITQVLQHLENPNARNAALNIILSLTEDINLVNILKETNICKELVRASEEEANAEVALKCLINLSQYEKLAKSMISLNILLRMFDQLKEEVKIDFTEIMSGSHTTLLEKEKGSYLIAKSDLAKIKEPNLEALQFIELRVMLINNLTRVDEGKKAILQNDNPTHKGYILELMSAWLFHYQKNAHFDFITAIISNVSSLKVGRIYLLEKFSKNKENSILVHLMEYVRTYLVSNLRKMHAIEIIRNCCFEYEEHFENLLDLQIVENVVSGLIYNNPKWFGIYKPESLVGMHNYWRKALEDVSYMERSQEEIDEIEKQTERINEMLVETLILLSNKDEFQKIIKDSKANILLERLDELLEKHPRYEDLSFKLKVVLHQAI